MYTAFGLGRDTDVMGGYVAFGLGILRLFPDEIINIGTDIIYRELRLCIIALEE